MEEELGKLSDKKKYDEKKKEINAKITQYKADLDYILNYPMTVKYVSLYPKVPDEKGAEKREVMRE